MYMVEVPAWFRCGYHKSARSYLDWTPLQKKTPNVRRSEEKTQNNTREYGHGYVTLIEMKP